MKVTIKKQDLIHLINLAQAIVEKRNAMPILSNLLMVAEPNSKESAEGPKSEIGKLEIFATDLEVSLHNEVNARIQVPGRVAINAKSFYEIVRELNDGDVVLEKQENNWLKIVQNKSVFNIVGVAPEEYPVFPTYLTKNFMKIPAQLLNEMIEKTIYSVSNDETRYHLNGVYFEYFEKEGEEKGSYLRMVATDGHRLSLVEKKTGETSDVNLTHGVIIPRKGIHEIRKLIENKDSGVELAVEGSQLIVRFENAVMLVRLIEGKYPNYRQLIPQNLPEELVVRKDALLSSLKRVSLLSNQKSRGVTLKLSEGRMQISSNNPELGDAAEELEVNYKGKEIKIGFNARYILDVLTNIEKESVEIELKDQLSPGLVRPHLDASYTCVVMPMRI